MTAKIPIVLAGLSAFLCNLGFCQRDPLVWEAYIASQSIYHEKGDKLTLELLFKKEGGPVKHTQQQLYVLAYLKSDERTILELAQDSAVLDKTNLEKPLFLDVLLERKLVTTLVTDVAKRTAKGAQDIVGSYGFEDDLFSGKSSLKLNTFPFSFTFSSTDVLEKVSQLSNFDSSKVEQRDALYFAQRFKLVVFAPVNDCKYATKIDPQQNEEYDFANIGANINETTGESIYSKTPVLYFKPLSFEFQFKKLDDGRIMIYIN